MKRRRFLTGSLGALILMLLPIPARARERWRLCPYHGRVEALEFEHVGAHEPHDMVRIAYCKTCCRPHRYADDPVAHIKVWTEKIGPDPRGRPPGMYAETAPFRNMIREVEF